MCKRNLLAAAIVLVSSAAIAEDHIRLPYLDYPEDRVSRHHSRHKAPRVEVIQDDVQFKPLPEREPPHSMKAAAPVSDPVVPEVAVEPLPYAPQQSSSPAAAAVAADPAPTQGRIVPKIVKTVPFKAQAQPSVQPPSPWGTLTRPQ